VIRTTRQMVLQQVTAHPPHPNTQLRVLIDPTSWEKCGKFLHWSTPTDDPQTPERWGRMLDGKRRFHLVVLHLVIDQWRVPWSFRVWRGKGCPTPVQLACQLLATLPTQLSQGRVVLVQADTEFGTVESLAAVRKRSWRALVGMRCHRQMSDARRQLKQLGRNG
jgi:hypothetical protein